MSVVIDGYNLLYALGRLTPRSRRPALEGARRWLMQQVRQLEGAGADVTIVFDGHSPPGRRDEGQPDVRILFSHRESADDVIETLIREASSPRSLCVVSDDHRLQQAASRRGCVVMRCLDYYERGRKAPISSPAEESIAKPESSSPEEVARYLEEFGDVGDDPLLRDPY